MIILKTWIEYIIIAVILIIISLVIVKLSKRAFKAEANKLITYLGGKDNIWAKNARCEIFKWKIYGEKRKKVYRRNSLRYTFF